MRFLFSRGIAVFTIVALAACGGRSMVPTQSSASGMPFAGTVAPSITNPCATIGKEGTWYFRGSCLSHTVQKSATLYKLKPYSGITQTVRFPAVSGTLSGKISVVVGEGTGPKNITGKFQGSKFPLYGSKSVPCVNQYSSSVSCGKPLVYDLWVNLSTTTTVYFVGSPSIALAAGTKLRGKKTCTLNQLIQSGGGWAYQATPVNGTIKKGKVQLPSFNGTFHLTAHTINVYAISCK